MGEARRLAGLTVNDSDSIRTYPIGLIAAVIGVGAMAVFFCLYTPFEPAGPHWSPPWPRRTEEVSASGWMGFGQRGVVFVHDGSEGPRVRLSAVPEWVPYVAWTSADLPDHRTVMVRVRWRGEGVVPGEQRHQTARVTLSVSDSAGVWRWDVPHVVASLYGSKNWQQCGRRFVLPEWASTACMAVVHGGVSGVVEVADLFAVPLRRRTSASWVLGGWWVLWVSGAALAVHRLQLLRRRGGRAVLAIAVLILVAVTMPEPWFHSVELWIRGHPLATAAATSKANISGAEHVTSCSAVSRTLSGSQPWWRSLLARADFHAIAHVGLFTALGVAAARCFGLQLVVPPMVWRAHLHTLGGFLVFGAAAEVIQALTITRNPGLRGAGLNWMGIGLGILIAEALDCSRGRATQAAQPRDVPPPSRSE